GDLSISDLVHIPGLFDTGTECTINEDEWKVVEQAAQAAIEQVVEMRKNEGNATAESLLELIQPIEDFSVSAREAAPGVIERFRERITARIEELRKSGIDTGDRNALEREVCLFADRADINEEMDRLTSHISQFRQAIESGGEIGKRLEFLAQEFLREVNTTASKANDTAIVTKAVDAKLAVEKIKEQSANIE
ncbi:MAG: DUF1732 domain-containing protein, partial [Planctomycetes bacterium]|nr:DUF1732 domain-containing protein [Planctomycetota bacterium]